MAQLYELFAKLQRSLWVMGLWALGAGGVAAQEVTVFAASSLRDALVEIEEAYEARGADVTLVLAASSAIARQVDQGAPADVVLLADTQWADWLVARGAVEGAVPFASNRLVLVGRDVPAFRITDLAGAVQGSVLAMAQVDAVPAGRYGKAALEALGLWESVQGDVVQAANVRAALRFVERGEAVLGIGYASDLIALPTLLEVYAFAPDTHAPIVYSGAGITPQGADFMTFLLGPPAQAILSDWGFAPLEGE